MAMPCYCLTHTHRFKNDYRLFLSNVAGQQTKKQYSITSYRTRVLRPSFFSAEFISATPPFRLVHQLTFIYGVANAAYYLLPRLYWEAISRWFDSAVPHTYLLNVSAKICRRTKWGKKVQYHDHYGWFIDWCFDESLFQSRWNCTL